MDHWLKTPILNLMESGLDGLALRHKVLADNIANVDTPGFKRTDLDFDQYLQAVMEKQRKAAVQAMSSQGGFSSVSVSPLDFLERDESLSFRNDKNNVDIDLEMTRLAENTLHYNALVTILSSHLSILKGIARS